MTILQALNGYYDRLAARHEVPPFGYSRERISYAIVLSLEGKAVDVQPLLDTSGEKLQPRLMAVPASFKRPGTQPKPFFLWDNTAFALGVSVQSSTRVSEKHLAFKVLLASALADAEDDGLTALQLFLDRWTPDQFDSPPFHEEMLDTNVVFRLDGESAFLHERSAAMRLVAARAAEAAGEKGRCLVTGEEAPIARLHPAIKGVQGAQTSGASIVSFNLDAFESFGKSQGDNAPVSEAAAFGYGTALNKLLERESRNRLRVGDTTTVFWAEAADAGEEAAVAAEAAFWTLVDPPSDAEEAAKVADVLRNVADGRPIEEAVPQVEPATRIYVLGLAPNASRLSVRFWHVDSIGKLAQRVGEHWRDLRVEPVPWKTAPAAWRLLYETAAQRKTDNIPPLLGGALMTAILTGGRYPGSLLSSIIMRMRADRDINGIRAAICKACLARDFRLGFEREDVPVSLDPEEANVAYRLGRLFAIYESVQRAALGKVNATIKDRYFGAASATPASIFPMLERNSVHHLSNLRKGDKGGLAHWFEHEIDQILSGLDNTAFPRSLRLQDQGRFALGYHHQRATRRSDAPAEAVADNNDEA